MRPAVSIIIPVYNSAPYLRECLDSVCAQTFTNFEVICVNDGSTDDSCQILEEYAAKDGRFILYSQKNAGLSAARNTGLTKANGDYVAFLDSDDFLDPCMLEKSYSTAIKVNAEIVIFDYWLYKKADLPLETYRDQKLFSDLSGTTFSLLDEPRIARFIGVWDRIFKRDFLIKGGFTFPVGKIYEDVPFCIETELEAKRITLLADHLYYYRRSNATSITAKESRDIRYKKDFLFVQSLAQKSLSNAAVSEDVWWNYTKYFFEYATMHQRQISDLKDFHWFYQAVHAMVAENMNGQGSAVDRLTCKLYWLCQKLNNCWATYIVLKGINQIVRAKNAFGQTKD